jgi:hypothetical protein
MIAAAIHRVIADDALVDRAAVRNQQISAEHLDRSVIQAEVVEVYRNLLTKSPTERPGVALEVPAEDTRVDA